MSYRRGGVVVTVLPGSYGKPRPAIVLQGSASLDLTDSVCLCPLTTHILPSNPLRHLISPSDENGLRKPSQVMIDKMMTIPRVKIGQTIGDLNAADLEAIDRILIPFLGLDIYVNV